MRDKQVFQILSKELEVLSELSHPNIVRFKQVTYRYLIA